MILKAFRLTCVLVIIASLFYLQATHPAKAANATLTTKTLWLTFDDGPHPTHTKMILSVLKENNAKATFFVVGSNVKAYPSIFKSVVAGGHEIANHSWNHTDMRTLSATSQKSQITRTQTQLGTYRGKCFRPPYGSYNTTTLNVVKSLGMRNVMWDVDTGDWRRPSVTTLANRIVSTAGDRKVILLHDGGSDGDNTARALKIALPKLRAKGYVFKVLPNCSW